MAELAEVRVPDIGDFDEVPVVEILVAPGDSVNEEDALLTLESDKASMDIPSPHSGIVKTVQVAVGDNVSEGTLVLTLEVTDAPDPNSMADTTPSVESNRQIEVRVPDIGDFQEVPVIEVMVSPGDEVKVNDPLITMESDKASMDIPTPSAGRVHDIKTAVGDKLSAGNLILVLEGHMESEPDTVPARAARDEDGNPTQPSMPAAEVSTPEASALAWRPSPTASLDRESQVPKKKPHATPSVRRFAQSLGADLENISGTGRKGRILKADVLRHVKDVMTQAQPAAASGNVITPIPSIDFSKFGDTETQPLSRIKKLSGANLHRAWLAVPHVTHHDEADITELEQFRKTNREHAKQRGIRLTPLAFIMKACVATLRAHPHVNASLDPTGENLILKHYFHIGVAVDTLDGLMVPVIRDVDQKGVEALAKELGEVSVKAREKKLGPNDMQGACFTISSLGGIGGTAFTPLVNAPEVAILGVARSTMKPIYIDGEFVPRLMLPLSLSYDHRVIDGAGAARFTRYLCDLLTDIRKLLL